MTEATQPHHWSPSCLWRQYLLWWQLFIVVSPTSTKRLSIVCDSATLYLWQPIKLLRWKYANPCALRELARHFTLQTSCLEIAAIFENKLEVVMSEKTNATSLTARKTSCLTLLLSYVRFVVGTVRVCSGSSTIKASADTMMFKFRPTSRVIQNVFTKSYSQIILMSLIRRNDVATSSWRTNDVIITSCFRWVYVLFFVLCRICHTSSCHSHKNFLHVCV